MRLNIRDTKGIFHVKMGTIKERNGMDLTEAEILRRGGIPLAKPLKSAEKLVEGEGRRTESIVKGKDNRQTLKLYDQQQCQVA